MNIDKKGDTDPHSAVPLNAGYTIQDWSTHEVLVSVEGINFIYVKDTKISMPNSTQFTTTFQSSTPDVEIQKITVMVYRFPTVERDNHHRYPKCKVRQHNHNESSS